MMKTTLALWLCCFLSVVTAHAEPQRIELWPDGAPGALGDTPQDRPDITIHSPDAKNRCGAAVIICPGGGYGFLASSYEGHDVARWFNSFGVTGIVLKYRIAKRYQHPAPLDDLHRAIRHVRSQAGNLQIDPDRIGVMGFSAGGHLAATATTWYDAGERGARDPIDRHSSRPNFAILAYPVITLQGPYAHAGSRTNLLGQSPDKNLVHKLSLENSVKKDSPPTFLFHTDADRAVPAENSTLFYTALRKAGVPAELHIFREGPHGVGLDRHDATKAWPGLLKTWMSRLHLLAPLAANDAKWIWLGKEAGNTQRVYFRKIIDVPKGIKKATFAGSCDNSMRVFVNGRKVASSSAWEHPTQTDLTKILKPGLNLIAIEGVNEGGPAGLVAQVDIELEGGKKRTIVTSRKWWVSDEETPRWSDIHFEPENWFAATELAKVGEGPWAENVSAISLTTAQKAREPQATAAEHLTVLPGFQVERLYSVPKTARGSWVSLCVDPKGRIIAGDQYGTLYRFMPPAPGKLLEEDAIERIDLDIGGAHGLLYAFDSLYVVRGEGAQGLYRVRDTNGDDKFDEVKLLRKLKGGGEHGPHSVILSPDGKSLYICAGNHTDLTEIATSLVPRVWGEDHLLPRQWDASGHARGRMAPGGWIARTDPDGKDWELVSIGYRNEFDIAFSPDGDLFSYDADMEWDVGSPWYRPTRVNHATSGSEFGWRSGTGKWPVYYPDSLGSVVDIGPGSPTGITFGTGTRFPEKYQRALFINDWSYGKLYAVHLEPDGATWKGTAEQFVAGTPLPLTEVIVHPGEGALYFAVGGRRTQSGLYRVTHEDSPKALALSPRITPEAKIRRELESLHKKTTGAVARAWPHLSHPDRTVRYAARVAIEHQPVAEWSSNALSERNSRAAIEAIIALARHGDASQGAAAVANLDRIDFSSLSEFSQLALLRAYGLVCIRMGRPSDAIVARLSTKFEALYPAATYDLNRELSRILVYLDSEKALPVTLDLLAKSPTQEEQIHYALILRNQIRGWNTARRRAYFSWFSAAGGFHGGHSFGGFLNNIKKEALARLSDAEKKEIADILKAKPRKVANVPQPSGPGQEWKIADLMPAIGDGLRGRDFANGKKMFAAAACFNCHRFASEGGATAPDLTVVSGRFSYRDLLESIIEPSKVVSDQYQATVFVLRNGAPVSGRVVNLSGDTIMVNTNMLNPNEQARVNTKHIVSMEPSDTSMMPAALLDRLNKDEILDLLAYLMSRGDRNNKVFN